MTDREHALSAITAVRKSPAKMKRRIMRARQDGHLSDAETEEWIAMAGLVSA